MSPKIYFRIPFTMYWLGRVQEGCKHEWSKLLLFRREFTGKEKEFYEWVKV